MRRARWLLTSLLLMGCGDSGTGPGPKDMSVERYNPLAVGAYWVYTYTDGSEIDSILISGVRTEEGTRFYRRDYYKNTEPWLSTEEWIEEGVAAVQVGKEPSEIGGMLKDSAE